MREALGSLDLQLRFAIAHRRLVQVSYGKQLRVVEPHDYGVKNGAPMLLAYQVGGGSPAKSESKGWRLLKLAKIEACMVWDTTFAGGRGDASQSHMQWDDLFARVTPAAGR